MWSLCASLASETRSASQGGDPTVNVANSAVPSRQARCLSEVRCRSTWGMGCTWKLTPTSATQYRSFTDSTVYGPGGHLLPPTGIVRDDEAAVTVCADRVALPKCRMARVNVGLPLSDNRRALPAQTVTDLRDTDGLVLCCTVTGSLGTFPGHPLASNRDEMVYFPGCFVLRERGDLGTVSRANRRPSRRIMSTQGPTPVSDMASSASSPSHSGTVLDLLHLTTERDASSTSRPFLLVSPRQL
mmetsp:Transcript_57780/g.125674  ORF Transcript_57780/g.125674 Transcript_57780/m.125674 type:complete len:243 (+) Transcript_57780:310-1038(+)